MIGFLFDVLVYLTKLFNHHADEIITHHEITARNRLLNVDGFGIARYTSPAGAATDFTHTMYLAERPAPYKTAQMPLHDTNSRSICTNNAGKAVFAHIRASPDTLVTAVNNHLFVFRRHISMYNEVISILSRSPAMWSIQ